MITEITALIVALTSLIIGVLHELHIRISEKIIKALKNKKTR